MSHESYLELIQEVDALVASFEQHPDPATRERVVALLERLDALHRRGLHRMVEVMREAGETSLLDRFAEDPVVEILLGLYDVVKLDVPDASPEDQGAQTFIPEDELTVLSESEEQRPNTGAGP